MSELEKEVNDLKNDLIFIGFELISSGSVSTGAIKKKDEWLSLWNKLQHISDLLEDEQRIAVGLAPFGQTS